MQKRREKFFMTALVGLALGGCGSEKPAAQDQAGQIQPAQTQAAQESPEVAKTGQAAAQPAAAEVDAALLSKVTGDTKVGDVLKLAAQSSNQQEFLNAAVEKMSVEQLSNYDKSMQQFIDGLSSSGRAILSKKTPNLKIAVGASDGNFSRSRDITEEEIIRLFTEDRSPDEPVVELTGLAVEYIYQLRAKQQKLPYSHLYLMTRKMSFSGFFASNAMHAVKEILERPLAWTEYNELVSAGMPKIFALNLSDSSIKVTYAEYYAALVPFIYNGHAVHDFVFVNCTDYISDLRPIPALTALAEGVYSGRSTVLTAPLYKNSELLKGVTEEEFMGAFKLLLREDSKLNEGEEFYLAGYRFLPESLRSDEFVKKLETLSKALGRNFDRYYQYEKDLKELVGKP